MTMESKFANALEAVKGFGRETTSAFTPRDDANVAVELGSVPVRPRLRSAHRPLVTPPWPGPTHTILCVPKD